MSVYTQTLTQTMSLARRHAAIGYALYEAGQPVTACQSNDQRRGWYNGYIGHMAAVNAEVECAIAYDAKAGF